LLVDLMREFDPVALRHDMPDYRLEAGDIGTVIDHDTPDAVTVLFPDSAGGTVAILTLSPEDLREPTRDELENRKRPDPMPTETHVPIADVRRETTGPAGSGRDVTVAEPGGLSHIDEAGNARMVDVTAKDETLRVATATGRVVMQPETLHNLLRGRIAKGNVLTTAQIAGVMAAERTHELIPMCHPLLLSGIDLELVPDEMASTVEITATVRTTGKTGVEMEALTAVSIAGLTIYDMCKAVDRGMRLEAVHLVSKSGGASGDYVAG
jgi:cyclic pyranopterin phosphate synthase